MARSTTPAGQADQLRRHQRALADFGLQAFRATDLDDLLQTAARLVSEALEVDLVKIMELRPKRRELLIRAGVNWQPGVVGNLTLSAEPTSPGGYALAADEAVISPDVSVERRFSIPPVLLEHGVQSMVNVIVSGDTRPFGVLEVDAQERRDFGEDDIAFLRNYANLLAAAVDRLRTHAALAEAVDHRQLLMLELQHRVKNILALVQSLASQSAANRNTAAEFRDTFLARLRALAQSHGLLFGEGTEGAGLRELVEQTVQPFREASGAVSVDGGAVSLSPKQGLALGLVLHELCTNAAKYGALAASEGGVNIRWEVEDGPARSVKLTWTERGGPPVSPAPGSGFGTRMIQRSVAYDLHGHADLDFGEAGLSCTIVFPAEAEGDA